MSDHRQVEEGPSCPIPDQSSGVITLAHGGGGRLMHALVEELFLKEFANPLLDRRHDAAVIEMNGVRIAFTTDTYVVQPLLFPGGTIGSLAVNGTVNDLAMAGATPQYLSAGFVLEEGLETGLLRTVAHSMRLAADAAGVQLVTGDTKVIEQGSGGGLIVNTAGIGFVEHDVDIGPHAVRPGDCIVVNGDIARHGIAVMIEREGLEFESNIESDSAPVASAVDDLLKSGVEVHCLRDLTRGGLTAVLNELAEASGKPIRVEEALIPLRHDVHAACELLGLDPLGVACEGRFIAFVPKDQVEAALDILAHHAGDTEPAMIGYVRDDEPVRVTIESAIGAVRILDMPSGGQLPRIC